MSGDTEYDILAEKVGDIDDTINATTSDKYTQVLRWNKAYRVHISAMLIVGV